ncbi:MAG: hypothetical protein PF488_00135 [Patescibacteria group bacterium]|jgi:hypothetical protein|nr:hypothetical protein [Patescibacteria group bacterium]
MKNGKMRVTKSPFRRERSKLKSRLFFRIFSVVIATSAWLAIASLADANIISNFWKTIFSIESFIVHLLTVLTGLLSYAYIKSANQMWNELGSMYLILVFASLIEAWSIGQIPIILPATSISTYIITRLIINYFNNVNRMRYKD